MVINLNNAGNNLRSFSLPNNDNSNKASPAGAVPIATGTALAEALI